MDILVIEDNAVLARKQGNVLLKVDQSTGLLCRVEESKNSQECPVYINSVEIEYGKPILLNVGDSVKFGREDFKLFNDLQEAQKTIPKASRRKYKRPANAYAPINFVNFYCAPPWALYLYVGLILCSLGSFIYRFDLVSPDHLNFLVEVYKKNIVTNCILIVGFTWFLCLIHSFAMYLYFNRNPLRQTLCTTILLIIVSCSVFWFGRPLRAIHGYVTARSKLLNHKIVPTDKIINKLKTLLEYKQKLIDSYAVIGPGLSAEEGDILKTDFESNLAKVDLELKKQ